MELISLLQALHSLHFNGVEYLKFYISRALSSIQCKEELIFENRLFKNQEKMESLRF